MLISTPEPGAGGFFRERPWCLSIMRVVGTKTEGLSISLWHQGQSALWEGRRGRQVFLTDTRASVSSMILPSPFYELDNTLIPIL